MLKIVFPSFELFDEDKSEFILLPSRQYTFEHSLLSISKWEGRWKKAFLKNQQKTQEEMIDYVRCMVVDGNVDEYFTMRLSGSIIDKIAKYIDDPMTATKCSNRGGRTTREVMTSELIYFHMIQNGIPFECQKWHINRLLTLINVCQIKNSGKKMSQSDILKSNAALNAERRKKYGTSG